MKRILLSVIGTVAGLVSLLSFKTAQPQTAAGPLPSAGLSATTPGSSATSSPTSTPSPSASGGTHAATAAARSYLGTAVTTQYGIVQVRVTVAKSRITDIAFVKLTAFDDRSQQINSDAAPRLLNEALAAQSAHIDTVSGASYTSAGYVQSLQSALDAAGIR